MPAPNDAVIVAARRTPIGRRQGRLSSVHPHVLLATAQNAALEDAGVAGHEVDIVLTGCVTKVGEQGYNIGRLAALASGLPDTVPGITLDAQCGSSQQAVNLAASMVSAGSASVVLVSGVESMSRVPLGADRVNGPGDALSAEYRSRYEDLTVGESAERIADRWNVTRKDADEWALRSHLLAAAARDGGLFADEMAPIVVDGVTVDTDEGIRDSTLAGLATLAPAFRGDGVLTAGSSSQISDGAAAVVVMSRQTAHERGVLARAHVAAQSIVGVDPIMRLTGPIPVTRAILQAVGMTIGDVGSFEVNEAFASVVISWLRETEAPADRVNTLGGAIALGHPVGSTGARLITTALNNMERRDDENALIAMCCGGGLGTGTLLVRG